MAANDYLRPTDWKSDEKLWDLLGYAPEIQPSSDFAYLVQQKLPADCKEDKKLWDLLGHTTEIQPSSNFAYRIEQKLATVSHSAKKHPALFPSLSYLFRKWISITALMTACLTVIVVWNHQHYSKLRQDEMITDLMQNYELIQDLDVIEHLDQL